MKTRNNSGPYLVKLILLVSVLAFNWSVIAHPNDLPALPESCTISFLPLPPAEHEQEILRCIPDNFNGTLVVYAHGYVPPQEDLTLP